MNITPFANFGNFENTPNLLPEKPTDSAGGDFSTILTNIVSVLQVPDSQIAGLLRAEPENPEPKSETELPPCDNMPFDKKALFTENNLLEIPSVEPKSVFSEITEQTTEVGTAEIAQPVEPASQKFSAENPLVEKTLPLINNSLPFTRNQTFSAENFLPQIAEDASYLPNNSIPAIVEDPASLAKISLPEFRQEQSAFVKNPLPEIITDNDLEVPKVFAQKILTESPKLEKSPSENPASQTPTLESLWEGTHVVIKQRINDYKFEEAVKDKLKTQINNLFQAQPNQKTVTPTKFENDAQIPANLIPELNVPQHQSENNTADPRLFQAETIVPLKIRILKFEKPLSNDVVLPVKNPKVYLPTTIPAAETESGSSSGGDSVELIDQFFEAKPELPVQPVSPNKAFITEVVFENDNNLVIKNDSDAQISTDVQTSADEQTPSEVEIPAVTIKPRFEGEKIKGFDITQNEVSSILKTFDNFFQKAEAPVRQAQPGGQSNEIAVSENFEEIAKSIQNSITEVPQTSDPVPETKKNIPNQPEGFWWNGQKTADDDEKIPVNQMNSFESPVEKKTKAAKDQHVSDWRSFFNPPQAENSSAIKLKTESAARIVNSELTVATEHKTLQAEKPGLEEIELKNGVNFERFLENISKEQKVDAGFRPFENESKKITEQINPHLLELAVLTNKTREKQTLKMRLHPAEFGAVEVTLERNQNGSLNAYFQTETDGARQVLSQNIENLRETLQQAGYQVGQMDVSSGAGSSTNSQQRENNPRQFSPVEGFVFSRSSDKPDAADQKSHNRLLSLLA